MTRPVARSHRVSRGAILSVGLGLAFLTAGPVCANEQRRNTPSFGIQYGYGALNGTGEFLWVADDPAPKVPANRHEDFRYGGALGIRIRYSLDQTHAVGVSFEDLRYGRKAGLENPENPADEPAKQLQVNTVVIDYLLYLNRRARATPYVLLGGGFHRDTFRFKKYDNVVAPIGPCANLGIGVEYFVRPAWTIDATLRGVWLGERGGGQLEFRGSAPVATSLQLGFQHYLLK